MPLGPAAWQRTADRIAGGLSWRNAGIDTAIYDIPGLTAAERRMIRQTPAPEGAIVVAHPLGAEGPVSLAVRADFEALAAAPGAPITQVAIAGHGGSALGAAALARTVADATGRPAGGIVAGFTGEDLFAEAMGGQVFFKALGSAQNAAQLFRHRLGQMALQAMRPGDRASRLPAHALTRPAAATLIRLLGDPERRLDLAVAHGKGGARALLRAGAAGGPRGPRPRRAYADRHRRLRHRLSGGDPLGHAVPRPVRRARHLQLRDRGGA